MKWRIIGEENNNNVNLKKKNVVLVQKVTLKIDVNLHNRDIILE